MLTKKKKGQISMEMLIVVGVLVIGGVIFGSIYLSNIQSQSKKGGDVSSIVDDLMGGFGGWNDDKWVPSIPDHCRNEVQDADEEDVDCGGNDCFECFTPGELAINLVLFPEGSTIVDDSFNINVLLTNGTDHSNSEVIIKEIKVENEITRTPTTNCSFNGSYTSTFSPSNLSFGSNDALSLAFSCNAPGEYRFTVYAGVAGNSDASLNSTESRIKEIIEEEGLITIEGSTTYVFKTLINTPKEFVDDIFFIDDSINFSSNHKLYKKISNVTGGREETEEVDISRYNINCVWKTDGGVILNNCNDRVSAEEILKMSASGGKFKIELHSSIEIPVAGGRPILLNDQDSTVIQILNFNPAIGFSLLSPENVFVNEEFEAKIFSNDLLKITAVNTSNFTFPGTSHGCSIISVSSSSENVNINGDSFYFKTIVAKCTIPSYSTTQCPTVLDSINLKFSKGSVTLTSSFTSSYDLSFKFNSCNNSFNSYGGLNACVLSDSGGNYNDFCSQQGYGLLKATINVSNGINKNSYGKLEVYIE